MMTDSLLRLATAQDLGAVNGLALSTNWLDLLSDDAPRLLQAGRDPGGKRPLHAVFTFPVAPASATAGVTIELSIMALAKTALTSGNVDFSTVLAGYATAASDIVTIASHGLVAGQPIQHVSAAPPGGLTQNVVMFVINPTDNTFQVSLTPGGAKVDITSAGTTDPQVMRCPPVVLGSSGAIPLTRITAGAQVAVALNPQILTQQNGIGSRYLFAAYRTSAALSASPNGGFVTVDLVETAPRTHSFSPGSYIVQ